MEFHPLIIGIQLLVFIGVILAVKFLYVNPILKLLKYRESLTKGRTSEATQLLERLESLRSDYDSKITNVRDEIERERSKALSDVRKQTEEKLAMARAEFDRKMSDATQSLEQEVSRVKAKLPELSSSVGQEIVHAVMDSKIARMSA